MRSVFHDAFVAEKAEHLKGCRDHPPTHTHTIQDVSYPTSLLLCKTQQARCVCGPIPSHPTSSSPGLGKKRKKKKVQSAGKAGAYVSFTDQRPEDGFTACARSHIHNTHRKPWRASVDQKKSKEPTRTCGKKPRQRLRFCCCCC